MSQPIEIAVRSDVRDAVRGLDTVERKTGRLGGIVAGVGKAVAGGLLVGGLAFGAFAADSVKSLARIETINAQTAQTVKSTGGIAGVTAKHIENLTGSLENLTATEAESIQEGANLLLTFTNVRNEVGKGNNVFDRATSTIVDMSRALGQDTKSSAMQLGKALNDPIKGVTALQRVGVSFTADQKEQIKTLVESGDTLKAQKIILGELNKEFGGSGEAFAATTTGKIELAKHAFGTLGETIFAQLLPPLGDLAVWATEGLNALTAGSGNVTGLANSISGRLGPAIEIATTYGALMVDYYTGLAHVFTGDVLPVIVAVATYLGSTFGPVIRDIGAIVIGDVIPGLQALGGFVAGTLVPIVMDIATKVGGNFKPVLDAVAGTLRANVLPAISSAADKFREWWPTIQKVAVAVLRVVGTAINLSTTITGKVLPPVIRFAGFLLGNLIGAVVGAIGVLIRIGGFLVDVGSKFVGAAHQASEFASGVKRRVGDAVDYVKGIPGRITSAIGDLGTLLKSAGADLIQGLLNGIISKAGSIASTLKTYVIDKIPGPVRKALEIFSPSRLFFRFGQYITGGLVLGIKAGSPEIADAATGMALTLRDAWAPDRLRIIPPESRRSFTPAAVRAASGARGNAPLEVEIELTAEQLSAIEQGRRAKVALRAYEKAGGQ